MDKEVIRTSRGTMDHSSDERVVIDSIGTFVQRTGSGKPLVLLHGLGGPQTWQRVVPQLAKHVQVVVPHLPGFGESDCPSPNLSTVEYAEFLARLLDILSIRRAVIAGTSFGGQIAVAFAHAHPERVERLVLISSTGLLSRRWLADNQVIWGAFSFFLKHLALRSRAALDLLSKRSFHSLASRPEGLVKEFQLQLSHPGKLDAWVNSLRNVFSPPKAFRQWLEQMSIPTSIVWGENDRTIPVEVGRDFQECVKDSKLRILVECAHSVPLERPEEVCKEIYIGNV